MSDKADTAGTKKYLKIFWLLVLLPFIAMALTIFLVSQNVIGKEPLPTFEQLDDPQSNLASAIISSDGKVQGQYFKEHRSNIQYEELAPNIIQALKATEDIRFERHTGVDIRGLMRAIFRGGTAGGGSTITQQLAKNLFHEKPSS